MKGCWLDQVSEYLSLRRKHSVNNIPGWEPKARVKPDRRFDRDTGPDGPGWIVCCPESFTRKALLWHWMPEYRQAERYSQKQSPEACESHTDLGGLVLGDQIGWQITENVI